MKRCYKCRTEKPTTDFYRKSDARDGLFPMCKSCSNAKTLAYAKTPAGRAYSNAYNQKWRRRPDGRAKYLVTVARQSAKRQGVPVEIDAAWVARRLKRGVCEVSGLPLAAADADTGNYHRHPRGASLDRIYPDKGYVPGNVRVVCWQINLARNEYGDAALLEMAKAIVTRQSAAKPRKRKVQRLGESRSVKRHEARSTLH